MCGIFGIVTTGDEDVSSAFLRRTTGKLFRYSETRGREAAGLALRVNGTIRVLKQAGSPSSFVRGPGCRQLLEEGLAEYEAGGGEGVALVGHSRLVTNGFQCDDDNNQPVIVPGLVGVHNGIVTNEDVLWSRYADLTREYDVDTELLLKVFRRHLDESGEPRSAAARTFDDIVGAASIALLPVDLPVVVLGTNTGALFYSVNTRGTFLVFASERFILLRLLQESAVGRVVGECAPVRQVRARQGVVVRIADLWIDHFDLAAQPPAASVSESPLGPAAAIVDHTRRVGDLQRCTRCILPVSYPLISFDEAGVCNFCRQHTAIEVQGEEALHRTVEPYRSRDGSPDCIVAFSGGRDSSYGLHYIKTVLGMNPVAFTYDWGMVTDLARRNCARVCGKLGVEHIVRSADIAAKRRFVRQQVEAWLARPELGMVTLFTAGDKEFYHHARALRRETGIQLVMFCAGNQIESAPYKFGFLGFQEQLHDMTLTGMKLRNKLKMLRYYILQVLRNPRYINASLWDAMRAYWHTFVEKDDFLYLYHYVPWHEEKVLRTIRREYDWEVALDTTTTWRIGDGTAAFYNYIYYTMSGFTEDDDMLSNMVREGHIDRGEALRRSAEYCRPRMRSLREYAQMIGLNLEEALNVINTAPRRY
jgi:glucosamine--fructose-6-phosphate aminotransferase (isomerizing)